MCSRQTQSCAFSAISMVIPVSMPMKLLSYQFRKRIECIHKSVLAPCARILALDGSQNTHRRLGQEWQRACRGTGHDGAVNGPHGRRTTPDDVTIFRVRGGYSPQIVTIAGELASQLQTETAMDIGSDRRVVKIVRILVFLAAKIEPGLRILVHKKRRERTDVAKAIVFECQPLPGVTMLFLRSGLDEEPKPSRYIIISSL